MAVLIAKANITSSGIYSRFVALARDSGPTHPCRNRWESNRILEKIMQNVVSQLSCEYDRRVQNKSGTQTILV